MGENLALNMEDHGFSVALWNRTEAKVAEVPGSGGAFASHFPAEHRPRRIQPEPGEQNGERHQDRRDDRGLTSMDGEHYY